MEKKPLFLRVPIESGISLGKSPSKYVRDSLEEDLAGLSPVLVLSGGLPAVNSGSVSWPFFREAGIEH